jgi:septum formation protein
MTVVLASASPIRRALLEGAGVPVSVMPARVDEDAVRRGLDAEGAKPRDVAEALAELKARKVASRHPGAVVLGCDQVLECDGSRFDKVDSITHAAQQLRRLQGRTHTLHTAVVAFRDGAPLWRVVPGVRLTMRPLGDDDIAAYLAEAGEAVLGSVGCYQFEGLGARLFADYQGDYFAVLGLPVLPVLDFLRNQGLIR